MKNNDVFRFPALWAYYGGGISITFPDLPGCVSHAQNDEEAFRVTKEVLLLHLYGMKKNGDPIPAPSPLSDLTHAANERILDIEVCIPSLPDDIRQLAADNLLNRIRNIPSMLYFTYNGKDGDIEIWSKQYRLTYDGNLLAAPPTAEELFHMPLFDGKTLEEIADQLVLEDG